MADEASRAHGRATDDVMMMGVLGGGCDGGRLGRFSLSHTRVISCFSRVRLYIIIILYIWIPYFITAVHAKARFQCAYLALLFLG